MRTFFGIAIQVAWGMYVAHIERSVFWGLCLLAASCPVMVMAWNAADRILFEEDLRQSNSEGGS